MCMYLYMYGFNPLLLLLPLSGGVVSTGQAFCTSNWSDGLHGLVDN